MIDINYIKLLKAHLITAFQNDADVSNTNYSSPFNLRMNCCIDLKFARNTCSKDIQNI